MDPEIKKALDEVKAAVGRNVEALARIDAIEAAAKTGVADLKLLRTELDAVKAAAVEREKTITEMQRNMRIVRQDADPIRRAHEATAMFGMIIRQELCRALRLEIPSAFAGEVELVRSYQADVLQRATLVSGATTGSYLVPTVTETQLIDTLEQVSDLLGEVEFIPGLPAASTINIPTLTGRPTLQPTRGTSATASDTKMTQSDATFGRLQLTPAEAYIYFPVDNKLIQMSALSLGSLLMNVLNDAVGQGICDWLVNGDGTSTYNSITGILNETDANYLQNLPAGKTAFANVTKEDLLKGMTRMLKRGRANGKWLLDLDVLGILQDIDRQGKTPLVKENANGEYLVYNRPCIIEPLMPDLADSGKSKGFLGLGDLMTFIVGLIGGIQIAQSSDYLFGNNQTAFRAVLNMDIKRKPVKTFMLYKTPAQ